METAALIVVGGSAGAIEALEVLLPRVTARHPPVVVTVHVSSRHRSRFAELFGPRCQVPVLEGNDKDRIDVGTITFAPSGYHLLVDPDFTVALSCDPLVQFARPSIDVTFESAAWAIGHGVLGIVLSGANEDGAAGSAAIVKAGGRFWTQEDAIFSTMPMAAAAAARAELTAPAETLAKRFASISTSRRGP